MRQNRSQTAKRRSHMAVSAKRSLTCECGAERLPHRACPECGKYRGRVVVDVVARQKKEARRAKRRAGETAPKETKKEEKEPASA